MRGGAKKDPNLVSSDELARLVAKECNFNSRECTEMIPALWRVILELLKQGKTIRFGKWGKLYIHKDKKHAIIKSRMTGWWWVFKRPAMYIKFEPSKSLKSDIDVLQHSDQSWKDAVTQEEIDDLMSREDNGLVPERWARGAMKWYGIDISKGERTPQPEGWPWPKDYIGKTYCTNDTTDEDDEE